MSPPAQQRREWRTSSRSVGNGQCVELAMGSTSTAVRDTKNREAGGLVFAGNAFRHFLNEVKADRLHVA